MGNGAMPLELLTKTPTLQYSTAPFPQSPQWRPSFFLVHGEGDIVYLG